MPTRETMVILLQRILILKLTFVRVTANGSYFENGKFIETEPMSIKRVYNLPQIGPKDIYLLHHEEMESLALNIKGIKRIRFLDDILRKLPDTFKGT